jgi:L-2-hydroxyglutarate oxidase
MYDAAVIGGGLVGLATGRELLSRTPGMRLLLLEKEHVLASHQSTTNSGVIHSGVYYAPGSLRATLCRRGGALLRSYCDERGIPYRRTGKLIVALDGDELPQLEELRRRGVANGVAGLAMLDARGLREREPHCAGVAALYVPQTAVVDFAAVASSLARDLAAAGAEIRTGAAIMGSRRGKDSIVLCTTTDEFEARRVVACAGLGADGVARALGGAPFPRVEPAAGSYLVLKPEKRDLVNACIYRAPNPRLPFLGAHVTPRIDGSVWLGPSDGPHPDVLAAIRQLIADIADDDVTDGPVGIRAQGVDDQDRYLDDFVFERLDGVLQVRNAPSPAATSCLAIAEHVAGLLQ